MQKIKDTLSTCPTCYRTITAEVHTNNSDVIMQKTCCEHGVFVGHIESDAEYYMNCMKSGANNIYNGYFLEVTRDCNLNCKYCFYDKRKDQPIHINSILQEAKIYSGLGPMIITGGEPTLRRDLPEIIAGVSKLGCGVELLTNGTGLTDSVLENVLPYLKNPNSNVVNINLSMHKESGGKDIDLIKRLGRRGLKLESILCVIDSLDQIDDIVDLVHENKNYIEAVRIKAATTLWDEKKSGPQRLFTSSIVNYMKDKYDVEDIWWRNNKVSFYNMKLDDVFYMVMSWYDVTNIDLNDISCPPYTLAQNGHPHNFVTACIINEGIQKGWLNGRRIESMCKIGE